MCCVHCRPSTAQEASSRGTSASRQPRQRTTLSRSSSASGAMPAATAPSLTARGPRTSLSSSDLGAALPSSRGQSQDGADDSMAVAVAPLPSARSRPQSQNSVPSLALGRRAPAQAAAGADASGPEGDVVSLPSARRATAVPKSIIALPSARRGGMVQSDLGAPLPSARRGTRDVSSNAAQADANAPLPSARRGTKDAPSSIPLPSARRFTRDDAGPPMYTPRQSSDLSSKSGGRWM